MIHQELGFILRPLPLKDRSYSLLTRHLGKIAIIAHPAKIYQQLLPGTLISISSHKRSSRSTIVDALEIILYPVGYHKTYIYWLHHALELCYYLVPPELPSPEIFIFLYRSVGLFARGKIFAPYFSLIKKISILRLLRLLGYYPPGKFNESLELYDALLEASIDLANDQKVSLLVRRLEKLSRQKLSGFDEWIKECLKGHPCEHLFKTVRFLDCI